MIEFWISVTISFTVAFVAIPSVIRIADKKKLYDIPDERKLHTNTIASLGGVGIFLGTIFASLLTIDFRLNPEFQYFLAAAVLLFFIGLTDDLVLLSAKYKFVVQIIIAAIIVHFGGIRIDSLYGLFGINSISAIIGIPLTYITIVFIINAFNLIDGIDGLAGSLGLLASLVFGTYFYFSGLHAYAIFSYSLSASLLGFLIFNYNPAKIFMGDSGSLFIGMALSILVLKFMNVAAAANAAIPLSAAMAIGLSVIIVPIIDTLRVFIVRIFKGRSPFSPDRNHIHHLLLDRGLGHASVTLFCVIGTSILVTTTYLLKFLGNTILVPGLFAACFILLGLLHFTAPKRRKRGYFSLRKAERPSSVKIITNKTSLEKVEL